MELVGKRVNHSKWGSGQITDIDDSNRITVEFGEKTGKFEFPCAFETFIKAEDVNLQQEIEKLIVEKHVEKTRKKEERYKELSVQGRYAGGGSSSDYDEKKFVPTKRIEGHALTFYCSQGFYFEPESELGLIWAPLYTHDGRSLYYWDNVMNVREGDIIIHGADGMIKAISRVKGPYTDSINPFKDWDKDTSSDEGRKVECDYKILMNPIATADFREDIIKYCQVKYAPFDKNGNGNSGYFFDLDAHLASIFVRAAMKKNPDVAKVEYLQWLLQMDDE